MIDCFTPLPQTTIMVNKNTPNVENVKVKEWRNVLRNLRVQYNLKFNVPPYPTLFLSLSLYLS